MKKYGKYALNSLLGVCVFFFFGIIFNGDKAKMFFAICSTFFILSYLMTRIRSSKTNDISISFVLTLISLLLFFVLDEVLTVAGQIIYVIMMPLSELMGSWAKKKKLQFAYFPLLLLFQKQTYSTFVLHQF